MSDDLRRALDYKFRPCPKCHRVAERCMVADPQAPTEVMYAYVCGACGHQQAFRDVYPNQEVTT